MFENASSITFDTPTKVSDLIRILMNGSTLIGIFGNGFVIYIFTRPKFIKIRMFRYFLVNEILKMIGILLLCVWFDKRWLTIKTSDIFCKAFEYIGYCIYTMHPWISALNSIDRLLSIKYQEKIKFHKKLRNQIMAILIIVFMVLFYTAPVFLYFEKSVVTTCAVETPLIGFHIYLINFIVSDIVPLLVMMTSSVLILKHLLNKKRRLLPKSKNFTREVQFVKSVLTIDLLTEIFLMPFFIIDFIESIFDLNGIVSPEIQIVHDSFVLLIALYSSLSFLFIFYVIDFLGITFCQFLNAVKGKTSKCLRQRYNALSNIFILYVSVN